jgi:AraC-like DNA-binding protein
MEKTRNNLDNSFFNIDTQIDNLKNVSAQILSSRQFSDMYFEANSPLQAFLFNRTEMQIYSVTNEYIFDIYIYGRKSGRVYSPMHLMSMESFIRFGPGYPDGSVLAENLASPPGDHWVSEAQMNIFRTTEDLLAYITESPGSITHSNTVVCLLLKGTVFKDPLNIALPWKNAAAAVYTDTGKRIFSLNPELNAILEEADGAGGGKYFAYTRSSARSGLTYRTLIPYSELTAPVNKYTASFIFVIIGILISGGLLIFVFMKTNYTPFKKAIAILEGFNTEAASRRGAAPPDYQSLRVELKSLEEAVRAGNWSKTDFILSQLINTIRDENTSYFFAVCLCYDIINTLIGEVYQLKNAKAREIITKHQDLFLENLDHPIERLIDIVRSLYGETMKALGQNARVPVIADRGSILEYIEKEIHSPDFSIKSIADYFNLSVSTLSHRFKTSAGENISVYISALKLNYAKELLCTTGKTVAEIAAELGYFQTSSFIKKFKSSCGITPGEYRAQHSRKG